ncbi:hypoxia up-regulated protein 1 isoform X1 [Bacillus rossius redtenbacheri]|uniref:hypoxia up-regulated protein 1 isoform X1 n=1 Tax=Bacillus rossius redtenbacheri TaxID=93214 RepID=UPI002FDD4E64
MVLRICIFLGLAALLCSQASGIAVMSVDLGSEWMKIAIVSPGVPMEIVLNKESKRKTPMTIAFRDGERTFGEDAVTVGVRFPKYSYSYFLDLVGKKLDNPVVKLFQKRFPYYDIVPDPERGTVLFRHDSETTYSPEELIGMFLHKAREFAEETAGQTITDAVIVVPAFFNQAERQAMLHAAELANLKVLQLMNDYTAVALNYGIFRRKDFNETAQYIMFYDMGSSSTTATVVGYQLVKTKEKGYVETNPQVFILGVGYDRTLGGLEIQLRLRDYLGKKFNEMKKTPNDVFKNPRALAKLYKEAGRVKNVLSANADHYAQVEGLLDDIDFKLHVTRDELEELSADLFDRVKAPVEQALKSSGLTMDVISQVILVGAGTRVPKVQEKLAEFVKMELGKNLNTDEAAVMGAVYKAADLSNGFKVKKFITKDAVLFPIQVTFEREVDGLTSPKQVKRTLFGYMNPYPQKKLLTFNKHQNDFSFNVNYAELDHFSPFEIEALGSLNLSRVSLTGVAEVIAKHQGENIESKGVKVHFLVDESGILNLTNVEFVAEKTLTDEELAAQEESTLSKLGSTLSSEEKKESNEEKPAPADDPKEEKPVTEEAEKDEKKAEGETGKKDENAEEVKNATKAVEKKPKQLQIKEPIKASEEKLGVIPISDKQFQECAKKIEELNRFDEQKRRREAALNALESFVFDAQNKLNTEEFQAAATPEEAEKIRSACQELSDWLYDEGEGAGVEAYEARLKELKALTGPLYRRVKEHRERPEALAALASMLNGSSNFLAGARNMSSQAEEGMFTAVELETLERVIKETQEWKENMEAEQAKLTPQETPKLTLRQITDKMGVLDREVKYLVNKAKIWRPKKTKESQKAQESGKNKTEGDGKPAEDAEAAKVAEEALEAEGVVPGESGGPELMPGDSVPDPGDQAPGGGEEEEQEVPALPGPDDQSVPDADEAEGSVKDVENHNEPSWFASALIVCTIHVLFVLTPV